MTLNHNMRKIKIYHSLREMKLIKVFFVPTNFRETFEQTQMLLYASSCKPYKYFKNLASMVVHAYNPSILRSSGKRNASLNAAWPTEQFRKALSQNNFMGEWEQRRWESKKN